MQRNKPVPNPMVVSREEFDDWAILFDPETGKAFGVNPIGTEIWNKLDGKRDLKKSCDIFRSHFDNVHSETAIHVGTFIKDLVKMNYLNMTGEIE